MNREWRMKRRALCFFLTKKPFYCIIISVVCRCGEIGRHEGLKIFLETEYGFDPRRRHAEAQNCSLIRMILGFFFLFHFLEALEGREGFAKKGGVSLVRNRDLRPAAKANPTIQQAFERFQKYNRLKNLSQGSLDFYAAKAEASFGFWGIQSSPSLPSQRKRWRTIFFI